MEQENIPSIKSYENNNNTVSQLSQLLILKEKGVIDENIYELEKEKLLSKYKNKNPNESTIDEITEKQIKVSPGIYTPYIPSVGTSKNSMTSFWVIISIIVLGFGSLLFYLLYENKLVDKTYYLLDGNINYSTYYASLKEIQLHFISNNEVETKMTFYADPMGYQIINDSSELQDSKIWDYKYEDGVLKLPAKNLSFKMDFLSNGNIKTNEGEYLYTNSIVSLLGTDNAYDRLKEDSKIGMAKIFKNFITKPSEPTLIKKHNQFIESRTTDNSSEENQNSDSIGE